MLTARRLHCTALHCKHTAHTLHGRTRHPAAAATADKEESLLEFVRVVFERVHQGVCRAIISSISCRCPRLTPLMHTRVKS